MIEPSFVIVIEHLINIIRKKNNPISEPTLEIKVSGQPMEQKEAVILEQLCEVMSKKHITDQEQADMLKQVQELLGTQLRQCIPYTGQYFTLKKQKNDQGIGLSILDNEGRFLLTDKLTRNILEVQGNPESQKTLFSFQCDAAKRGLKQQQDAFDDMSCEHELIMTIYSESTRKKVMKLLNSRGSNSQKQESAGDKKDLMDEDKIGKRKALQKQKLQKTTESFKDQYIEKPQQPQYSLRQMQVYYLKSIQVKMSQIIFQTEPTFLNSLRNQKDIIGSTLLDNIDVNVPVVLCEISEIPHFEPIELSDLKNDKKIENFQQKYQDRLNKIRVQSPTAQDVKRAKWNRKFSESSDYCSTNKYLGEINDEIDMVANFED